MSTVLLAVPKKQNMSQGSGASSTCERWRPGHRQVSQGWGEPVPYHTACRGHLSALPWRAAGAMEHRTLRVLPSDRRGSWSIYTPTPGKHWWELLLGWVDSKAGSCSKRKVQIRTKMPADTGRVEVVSTSLRKSEVTFVLPVASSIRVRVSALPEGPQNRLRTSWLSGSGLESPCHSLRLVWCTICLWLAHILTTLSFIVSFNRPSNIYWVFFCLAGVELKAGVQNQIKRSLPWSIL